MDYETSASRGPTVREYMTASPQCIPAEERLDTASARMDKLRLRHVPVLSGGQLVGVLSDRDIALLRATLPGRLEGITVEQAMTAVPYCVAPDTTVAAAARHMALRKLGSALVVEHGKVVGVFTTTEALRLLSALLEPGENETADARTRVRSISIPAPGKPGDQA